MLSKLIERLGLGLSQLRGTRLGDGIARRLAILQRLSENEHFRPEKNGEELVLRKLARFGPRCILDVGANVGQYAMMAARLCPDADIHAFEPMPDTFEKLLAETRSLQHVHCLRTALGEIEGSLTFHRSSGRSDTDSAFPVTGGPLPPGHYTSVVEAPVMRGDKFIEMRGIESIDLLKVDAEGMDLRVLRGFGNALDRVEVLQFEYGVFNVGSRDLLADFFSWLEPRGFTVGRIYPHHVQFSRYEVTMEHFIGGNYLAVRTNLPEKLALFAKRSSNRGDSKNVAT